MLLQEQEECEKREREKKRKREETKASYTHTRYVMEQVNATRRHWKRTQTDGGVALFGEHNSVWVITFGGKEFWYPRPKEWLYWMHATWWNCASLISLPSSPLFPAYLNLCVTHLHTCFQCASFSHTHGPCNTHISVYTHIHDMKKHMAHDP